MTTAYLQALEEVALRVKSERDRALQLLREGMRYRETGPQGPFKTKVREFLQSLSECPQCGSIEIFPREAPQWICRDCGATWGRS